MLEKGTAHAIFFSVIKPNNDILVGFNYNTFVGLTVVPFLHSFKGCPMVPPRFQEVENVYFSRCPTLLLYTMNQGKKGTISCLLHQSLKFYNNGFLFVGLKTLETFIEF